jgi:hypothetical protein
MGSPCSTRSTGTAVSPSPSYKPSTCWSSMGSTVGVSPWDAEADRKGPSTG